VLVTDALAPAPVAASALLEIRLPLLTLEPPSTSRILLVSHLSSETEQSKIFGAKEELRVLAFTFERRAQH
jgi:hypothetical protein